MSDFQLKNSAAFDFLLFDGMESFCISVDGGNFEMVLMFGFGHFSDLIHHACLVLRASGCVLHAVGCLWQVIIRDVNVVVVVVVVVVIVRVVLEAHCVIRRHVQYTIPSSFSISQGGDDGLYITHQHQGH